MPTDTYVSPQLTTIKLNRSIWTKIEKVRKFTWYISWETYQLSHDATIYNHINSITRVVAFSSVTVIKFVPSVS